MCILYVCYVQVTLQQPGSGMLGSSDALLLLSNLVKYMGFRKTLDIGNHYFVHLCLYSVGGQSCVLISSPTFQPPRPTLRFQFIWSDFSQSRSDTMSIWSRSDSRSFTWVKVTHKVYCLGQGQTQGILPFHI